MRAGGNKTTGKQAAVGVEAFKTQQQKLVSNKQAEKEKEEKCSF